MENKTIAQHLRLLSQLMELYDENPFKVKSIANAAFKIDKLPFPLANKNLDEIDQIEGLGKSIASKVLELITTESLKESKHLLEQTPTGILEMLQIKGIGPKKIKTIWKDLGIENCGELYYACNENRLIQAKGFGAKTQADIKNLLEFKIANNGYFLYARIEDFAEKLIQQLQDLWPQTLLSYVGTYRRRCEIINTLDVLVASSFNDQTLSQLKHIGLSVVQWNTQTVECSNIEGLKVRFTSCSTDNFGWKMIEHTGNTVHVEELEKLIITQNFTEKKEPEIYKLAGIPFIEPELREGTNEIKLAQLNKLPKLIELTDLKGSLHNHSNWSDGINTLEEMAIFCRDKLSMEYFGICDHSKSAFYANGLEENRIRAQHQEIDELNKKLNPFHIFKGIESDILFDGSLDYPNDILKTFDFVVASIHSVLKMSEAKATERLIKAIENPFTTILGHPTGRLLLTRSGYEIDYKKVIDACAVNEVVIEINANPLRLDLDWRWHQYAIEKGVKLSINPDAHRTESLFDIRYGVLAARKGGLAKENCLNTYSLTQIKTFFESKRKS